MPPHPSSSPSHFAPSESVYNLIPQPVPAQVKPERYRSKYPATIPPTASTFGMSTATTVLTTNMAGDFEPQATTHRYIKSGATLGPKTDHVSDPHTFQRKHSNPPLPTPTRFAYPSLTKPSLDSGLLNETAPVFAPKTTKNFISENALKVIMSQARPPRNSSFNYLTKRDYGQVPEYLDHVKEEVQFERDYVRAIMEHEEKEREVGKPHARLLPEDERVQLVAQLKKRWEVINSAYQTITHMVTLDTTGKIRRKEEYERQLEMIEKSIEKLNRPNVLVYE